MIGIISHHYCKPGTEKQATEMIRHAGMAMRGFRGFVSRYTFVAQKDPLKVTTVTLWHSLTNQEAWFNGPERKSITGGGHTFWSKPPEMEFFNVEPEL